MITAKDIAIEQREHEAMDYLLTLLDNSCFPEERRIPLESQIKRLEAEDEEEYTLLVNKLWANQRDRIVSGDPYNATDIKNHLKKLR